MEKYTFVKGQATKRQDTLDFKEALIADGWILEGEKPKAEKAKEEPVEREGDYREVLEARAKDAGVTFRATLSTEKLEQRVKEAENGNG